MTKAGLTARSIVLGTGAAIVYGIVHDQISVRISPPYLLDWHPEIVSTRDPTRVALAWGVVATWWFGLILGVVLAAAATLGNRPMAPWRCIVQSTGFVFAIAAVATAVAFGITRGFGLELPVSFGPIYTNLPKNGRLAFAQTATMHETSYDAAAIATLVAAGWIVWKRRPLAQ